MDISSKKEQAVNPALLCILTVMCIYLLFDSETLQFKPKEVLCENI